MRHEFEIATSDETALSIREVESFSLFVSRIVNAKTSFTIDHSHRVAQISQKLSKEIRLNGDVHTFLKKILDTYDAVATG